MRIALFLLAIMTISMPVSSQKIGSWIQQPGYAAYMWPSFRQLQSTTSPIDLTGFDIIGSDYDSGRIELFDCTVSKNEALTAALMLIGGSYEIEKYGISKNKPNLIPYKGGVIVYGYWKQKQHWELFNVVTNVLTEHLPYKRFDVRKK